ncbi:HAD family hydrolase [Micromonospora sp. DT228]|uniref:HAD family hydrolase n=1 Tax=Micromonospora sp. DT228 TaxID=3393443 RepID=UPI003CEF365A
MAGPKVVLFDLDGVLVDSQGAENDALLYLADLVGAPITAADAELMFTGRRIAESVDYLTEYATRPMPADPVGVVRARCAELVAGRMQAVPGVESALRAITVPKYVVSNSPLEMIGDRLRMTGLDGYFPEAHFSAYEIGVWKPDPGLYRVAAESVAVEPADALVIEDSMVGVVAAATAGMRVLWYRPRPDPADPDIPGVRRLPDMFGLATAAATESGDLWHFAPQAEKPIPDRA